MECEAVMVTDRVKEDIILLQLAEMTFVSTDGAPDFLDYVKILETAQPLMNIDGGAIPFQKWPYLIELARDLVSNRLLVTLKARQVGFSWLVSAYAAWMLRFHEGAHVLTVSRGQLEAYGLLEKVRFILTNLPQEWQLRLDPDSRSEIGIPEMKSRVQALPSTPDAGRSGTESLVILDEADFHEYLAEASLAIKPTVDAGGQFIMGSTSNKREAVSVFKENYRNAPGNGWRKRFVGWDARPGRTVKWYEEKKNEITEAELQGLTAAFFMEQEYPGSENEALSPARTEAAFDLDVLQDMEANDVREPLRTEGSIKYFQDSQPYRGYYAGTDSAEGRGRDYSVTVIIDSRSGAIVADLMSNEMPPDVFAAESLWMLEKYGQPQWVIELNNGGGEIVRAAMSQGYRRLWAPTYAKKASGDYGLRTTGFNRGKIWDKLRSTVRGRAIIVPNKDGLAQFFDTVSNSKTGNIAAVGGKHDDYPMACALALQGDENVISSEGKGYKVSPVY